MTTTTIMLKLNDSNVGCAVRLWCDAEFGELEDIAAEYGTVGTIQSEVNDRLCSGTGIVYDNSAKANTWDVSEVKFMAVLFKDHLNCNLEINGWRTGAVTDMTCMFSGAMAFNQPLDSWQTGSVGNMGAMFYNAREFDQNINSWQMGSVRFMGSMFKQATSFNQNISSWQLESVEPGGKNNMFDGANPNCTSISTCGN